MGVILFTLADKYILAIHISMVLVRKFSYRFGFGVLFQLSHLENGEWYLNHGWLVSTLHCFCYSLVMMRAF